MSDTPTLITPSAVYGANFMERATGQSLMELQQLSLNSRLITENNPWLAQRPDAVWELANSGMSPEQLAANSAALYGMQNLEGLAASLDKMTDVGKRSTFNQLTEQQQAGLRELGFEEPDRDQGIIGQITSAGFGAAGAVAKPVFSGVGTVLGPVAGPALDLLTVVGDQPAHLYRTIRSMDPAYQWIALAGAVAAAPFAAGAAATAGLSTGVAAGATGLAAIGGATAAAAISNPSQWHDAFQTTWDGERAFTQGSQQRARELLVDDRFVNLAKDLSLELDRDVDMYDLAVEAVGQRGGIGQTEAAARRMANALATPGSEANKMLMNGMLRILEVPEFREAVDTLNEGKISFGRDIANLAQLDENSGLHTILSGSMDAAWLFAMDPLLLAGVATKARKVARYGLPTEGGDAAIQRFISLSNNDDKVQKVHNAIVAGVNQGDTNLMPRASREFFFPLREHMRQIGYINDEGIVVRELDRGEFLEWVTNGKAWENVLGGVGLVAGNERKVISVASPNRGVGRFTNQLRRMRDAVDDADLDSIAQKTSKAYGVESDVNQARISTIFDQSDSWDLVQADQVIDASGEVIELSGTAQKLFKMVPGTGTVARLLGGLTNMAPAGQAVKLAGPGSVDSIGRWVSTMGRMFGMKSGYRDEWLRMILQQGDTAQRMKVMTSFMGSLMDFSGVTATESGRQLAEELITKYRQGYALGGLDEITDGGRSIVTGVLYDAHQANHLLVPSIPDLQKVVVRSNFYRHIAKITDSEMVEQSMSRVWKPLVLMRIGFIPRAAGEEALAWFARMSEGALAQEYGARFLSERNASRHVTEMLEDPNFVANAWQKTALEKWSAPAHMRPVRAMFARRGWKHPTESIIENWAGFLEQRVATGLGQADLLAAMEASKWSSITLGRPLSWRRMILNGVDPTLRQAADRWTVRHADQIMRSTSNMSASMYERNVPPDAVTMLVPDQDSPTGFASKEMTTLRGERELYQRGDEYFDNSIMHRMQELFGDRHAGPALMDAYLHAPFPELDNLTPLQWFEGLQQVADVQSLPGRQILDAVLNNSHDYWMSAAQAMRSTNPVLANIIDSHTMAGGLDIIKLRGQLMNRITDLRSAERTTEAVSEANQLTVLLNEIESIAGVMELMEGADATKRGYLMATLGAQLHAPGEFYDLGAVHDFVTGAVESAPRRPNYSLYQPIESTDALEVTQDGNLVVRPQHQSSWGGDGINLSSSPQSGVDPEHPGVMIEFDGDYLLQLHGRDHDAMMRDGLSTNLADQADPTDAVFSVDDNGEILILAGSDDWVNPNLNADGNLEVPAGKWRVVNSDGMQHGTEGGFGTVDTPKWTPFFDTDEDMWSATQRTFTARAQLPEFQDQVRSARRSLASGDEPVRVPLTEGMDRVHVPTVGPDAVAAKIMDDSVQKVKDRYSAEGRRIYARSMGPIEDLDPSLVVPWEQFRWDTAQQMADDLLAMPHATRVERRFMEQLEEGPRRNALEVALYQLTDPLDPSGRPTVTNMERAGSEITEMLQGVGYSDPRLAAWVSDVLTGSDSQTTAGMNQMVGWTDIPRGLHGQQSGVSFHSDYGPGGNSYQLDQVAAEAAKFTPTRHYKYGEVGVPWTAAIEDASGVQIRHARATHTGGATQQYQLRENAPPLYRKLGNGETQAVEPGATFGSQMELYDENDRLINWGDRKYFKDQLTDAEDGELLWAAIGPMIKDQAQQMAGNQLVVPRSYYKPEYGEAIELVDNAVTMTNSRIDDLATVKSYLPSAVWGERRTAVPDKLWDRIVRFGFDSVIGPALDSLVRKPMSFHYYQLAYRENLNYLSWMLDKNLIRTVGSQFDREIGMLDTATDLTPRQLAAAQVVDRQGFVDPIELTEDVAKNWIGSIGKTNEEYQATLMSMLDGTRYEGVVDTEMIDAIGVLAEIDPAPFRVAGVAPAGSNSAERLIMAFEDAVPADVWDEGFAAVNRYVSANRLGLPALDEQKYHTMHASVKNYRHVFDAVEESAVNQALANVIPFLDDHTQRSQFAVLVRNMMPFWYAEENFLKRWARTLAIAPEAIRKGQLLYMGMRSAGVVRTDVNGQDWVVYPGSGLLTEGLEKIMPGDALPVGVLFQASTDSLLPGMNARAGSPGLGPLAAVQVDLITKVFPDAVDVQRAVQGDAAAGRTQGLGVVRSVTQQFMPTTLQRVWDAVLTDETSSVKYANAMMYAIANMQAEGNWVDETSSPAEVEEALDKARNHARIVLTAQLFAGFISPGSPQPIVTGEDAFDFNFSDGIQIGTFEWLTGMGAENPDQLLSGEYRRLITDFGIDEGTREFLNLYPQSDLEDMVNPLAYTTPTSSSVSGAALPATRIGLQWYEDNQEWVDSMPEAGAWFLPPDDESEEFDFYAYSQQTITGLRKRQTPEDFLNAMIYRKSAGPYFQEKDRYDQTLLEVGDNDEARAMVTEHWSRWSSEYMAAHPVFAEEIQGTGARERRDRIVAQMHDAVRDPLHPETPTFDGIAEMQHAWEDFAYTKEMLSQSRSASFVAASKALDMAYSDWATDWTIRNPSLERLWTSVYRPKANL